MRTTDTSVCKGHLKKLQDATVTEDIRLISERELNETDETRKKCLEELRILLKGEKELVANTSDDFLLQFLRAKKFKTESALGTLKNFYGHRVTYPSIYDNYSPKQNLEVLKANLLNFLPSRAPDDSAIWIARVGQWDPKELDFEALLRFGFLCHEKVLQNPITQICGITSIIDLEGFSWSHILRLPPSLIKCFVSVAQDSLAIRHKGIHIINNPSVFGLLFTIMKPFITSKIIKRIYFHGYNLNSLHQHVPTCCLPEEFGGDLGPFKNEQFYDSLLESEEQFLANQTYGYVTENK